jgi:hypothetical protein
VLKEAEGAPGAWTPHTTAEHVVQVLLLPNDLIVAESALDESLWPLEREAAPAKPNLFRKGLRRAQALVVRDIFGNPFRPPGVAPAWRTGTVRALTDDIYAGRAFDRLPILADALEEAGCANADILSHCHSSGPHVRGCWVVDLVLGNK